MSDRTCQKIKSNGTLCQAYAMNGSDYCYFHNRMQQRHDNWSRALGQRRYDVANFNGHHRMKPVPGAEGKLWFDDLAAEVLETLQLPDLEDKASIQIALNSIMRGVLTQLVTPAQARVLLYMVQLSMHNLKGPELLPDRRHNTTVISDPTPIHKMREPTPEQLQAMRRDIIGDIRMHGLDPKAESIDPVYKFEMPKPPAPPAKAGSGT